MKKWIAIIVLVLGTIGIVFFYFQIGNNTNTMQTNQATSDRLQAADFQKALASGEYTLLDIRTIEEYNEGHLKDAIQKDFYLTDSFTQYLQSLDKNKKYLIYCRSGNRSGKALTQMKRMGFTNVADLEGGIGAWTAANLPLEK